MRSGGGSGGGEGRPRPDPDDPSVILHEEEPTVGTRWEDVGQAHVRRTVEHERARGRYPREVERLAQERVPAAENDSGEIETLPDGSISIPLFEEQLVVTTKTVLRERVIIRKETVTEWQKVEATLRRERVDIDPGDGPEGAVTGWHASAGARRPFIETKPFFLTSEFVLALLAWFALLLTTLALDSLDAWLFWVLTVVIAVAYMLARGAAKTGTPSRAADPRESWQPRTERRSDDDDD